MLSGLTKVVLCSLTFSSAVFAGELPPPLSTATNSTQLGSMLESQKEIFEKAHLTPIIIPQGEHVGDIIDVSSATLIATADDCFPGLNPRKTSSVLPQRIILSEKGLGAALGVAEIGQASGQIEGGHTFVLDFEDVRVERVSQYQLRTNLKKEGISECDRVKPFMLEDQPATAATSGAPEVGVKTDPSAVRTIVSQRPPPLLIGEVFYARRIVHVQTTQKITGDAQASLGERILRTLGISSTFKVSATGNQNTSDTFDLIGQQSIPVALAPAFVITTSKSLADGRTEYRVANLDPDLIETEIQLARLPAPTLTVTLGNVRNILATFKSHHLHLVEEPTILSREDALYGALYQKKVM